MSIYSKIEKVLKISISQFIRLNFLSPQIKRKNGAIIIPYRGTHVKIAKSARVEFNGGRIVLNANKIGMSKAECIVELRENARLVIDSGLFMYYNTGLQVHKDAYLHIGQLNMNTEGLIICGKHISIGEKCSAARRVYIFDSDHHPIYDAEKNRINEAKDIIIEDRVWLGLKSTVMKGSHIGHDTVIGSHSLVAGEIPAHCMVAATPARPVMKDISWER